MFFSNPSQAMTFPSCRGSAYVTAELRGLKPFISSDLPLAVAAPRNRQKQKHHSCVTFSHCQLSVTCWSLAGHLLVTCWSLAGNFEGALKVTDQTLDFAKRRKLFVGIIPFCNPDTPNFHGHSHYLVGGLEHFL